MKYAALPMIKKGDMGRLAFDPLSNIRCRFFLANFVVDDFLGGLLFFTCLLSSKGDLSWLRI
ncbi:MAG: hypothetical protein ACXU7D_02630 [Burkholderiaceae bacterium]